MPVCEIDLRPGGAWRFLWRHSDGTQMGMHGVYQEITPPARLVCTESWGGDWPETLNTLILSEEDGKTTITSTVLYASKEVRDTALRTGMKEGVLRTSRALRGVVVEPRVGRAREESFAPGQRRPDFARRGTGE